MSRYVDFEKQLNPSQFEAVSVEAGPVLVVAGAGSGKTRTIVYRVAWLVNKGVPPSAILLMTFTRKAAQEMLSRASDLIERELWDVAGGTFHSTANLALRRYAKYLELDSSYGIMDQSDAIAALDHIKKDRGAAGKLPKGFPKSRTIADIISRSSGAESSIEEVLKHRYPHFIEFASLIEQIHDSYVSHKRLNNLLDYDDLLLYFKTLLETSPEVRERLSQRWRHILVDEYQDTNPLQGRIVRLLAYTHENVMAVGDDSQSIYSFRGADFRNIMEFPNIFHGTRLIRLEENYRSTQQILHLTNSLIARAATGYPKVLFSKKKAGRRPCMFQPWNEREQSELIVRLIQESVRNRVRLSDIAVLFRAGFHSFDLEGELAKNKVPFVKYGGVKFSESQHIKDVLAYLRVINNHRDRLSWIRILTLLPGVGARTAAKLAAAISQEAELSKCIDLVPSSRKFKSDFDRMLHTLLAVKNTKSDLGAKVEEINRYYYPFLQERFDNYPKRARELEQLANLISPYKTLGEFLNDMALDPPEDADVSESYHDRERLVLSTIHSAKGLEWHTVFLIWVVEGRIPAPQAEAFEEDLEEERRLLYVATTRAKERLFLFAPRSMFDRRFGSVPTTVSRFIAEVSDSCLEWGAPK